ncbi:hypothetical protein [Pseudidiomarina insulisalsae]|uniref:Uncharacterized protein n=1 Tax=Pseudidiomarina insulisalsae TaxID=575789 RepID=A0A432YLW1_9GAMM|nr:hypothetical protein [Pseudidiomarina insulisalsae]RUO61936.1 hypothetical protein CWI71_06165 [Pseudidiomarina insulisalsae]
MSALWVINGWRQQSRVTRQIDQALRTARERGMQSYALHRQGRNYWLVCSSEPASSVRYDLAQSVRRQFRQIQQGIYLAQWQGLLICVMWSGERLQHCQSFSHDADGLQHLQLLLERVMRKNRRKAAVLLAKDVPDAVADYCHEHLDQWQLLSGQVEVSALPLNKPSKLIDLAAPTPWQRRQRLFLSCLFILLSAAMLGWYFWPQTLMQAETRAAAIAQPLPPPPGIMPSALTELPRLFAGLSHLAGWQWQSAHLQGRQLHVTLTPSYGRPEELAAQVAPDWQLQAGREKATLTYDFYSDAWQARADERFSLQHWSQQSRRFFPQLITQGVREQQNQLFRYQQQTFSLTVTSLNELAQLEILFTHPNMRLISIKLRPGDPLKAELGVGVYFRAPPEKQGE